MLKTSTMNIRKQKNKTLLQINTTINSGSTGRIAEEIGKLVIQNGWNSYIAYGRNKQTSKSIPIKVGTDLELKLHGLQTRLFDNHGFASKNATLKLVNRINEIKPDIIHLHNLHGYYLNIEILFNYLSISDIPIIWTFHDCWPMTGHCTHFDFIGCKKWKTQCFCCPQKSIYPASFFIDRSRNNFNAKKKLFTSSKNLTIVPVSNWLGGIVQQSFLADIPMRVIHNGVDTDFFSPRNKTNIRAKYNLDTKFIILGVASVWSPQKGLYDFVELSKQIDTETIIVLVGLSRQQIQNLPANIIGISRTENIQELVELYSSANLYVNTSIEETFGLTTAEALSCGTPAVVYNATACPEVINESTGFVIEKNNIKELLQVVNFVKANGKGNYSENCIKRIKDRFNKDDKYQEYLDLYDQLLPFEK
jgi:putative colanic acid biosynthesis glycosyltransferase